jgi:hypothetical protein
MKAWIETKEQLPEFHKDILFYAGGNDGVRMGRFYRHSHNFISDGDKFFKPHVSHWMEIPDAPTINK